MVLEKQDLDMPKLLNNKDNKPMVSILCLAYNQKDYIKKALDGFLMQETNFKYEVLIHDDASNDGTADIIKEYQKKNPEIIKPIYQKKNQFSQGVKITPIYQLPRVKGTYIAICEGDDYWTDPKKLQTQVDYMEKNSSHALCFHPVKVFFENNEHKESVFPTEKTGFTLNKLLQGNFIQTNSVMYRALSSYKDIAKDVMPGDYYLHLYHAKNGKIGFIDKVMAAYRKHEGGVWWHSATDSNKIYLKYGLEHLVLYFELLRLYGDNPKYRKHIESSIGDLMYVLCEVDEEYSPFPTIIHRVVLRFPKEQEYIIQLIHQKRIRDIHHINKLDKDVEYLTGVSDYKDEVIADLEKHIDILESGSSWRKIFNSSRQECDCTRCNEDKKRES